MAIDRGVFLEIVKDAYSAYYTILPVEEGQEELPLAFRAEYNVRDEQYFFVKSANIWKNEKHEYCFVFSAPSFDPALAEECIDFSLKEMLPKVKPHKEHQYTNCNRRFLRRRNDQDRQKEALFQVLRAALDPRLYRAAVRGGGYDGGKGLRQPGRPRPGGILR